MAGFEFPNDAARIAVFATLGSLIFLIAIFILTLIIRICCCIGERKKTPDQVTIQTVQQVAVVQPQKKVTPNVTPDVKKKETTKPAPSKEEISPEPVKKKNKPNVQFNTETEIVPRERISYTENAYEEIHQTPEYADTDDVTRPRRQQGYQGELSPGDFGTPRGNDVVIGPQIVPMGTDIPSQNEGHIPHAPPPPEISNLTSPQPVTNISHTGTYPPHHGQGNGTVAMETDEVHSNTVPAKVRKAKKGGKRYITPKRFRGKPKNKETTNESEDDVVPEMVATTFIIPEEDRMY